MKKKNFGVACGEEDRDNESGYGDWFHVRYTNLSSATTVAKDLKDIGWLCEACVE